MALGHSVLSKVVAVWIDITDFFGRWWKQNMYQHIRLRLLLYFLYLVKLGMLRSTKYIQIAIRPDGGPMKGAN